MPAERPDQAEQPFLPHGEVLEGNESVTFPITPMSKGEHHVYVDLAWPVIAELELGQGNRYALITRPSQSYTDAGVCVVPVQKVGETIDGEMAYGVTDPRGILKNTGLTRGWRYGMGWDSQAKLPGDPPSDTASKWEHVLYEIPLDEQVLSITNADPEHTTVVRYAGQDAEGARPEAEPLGSHIGVAERPKPGKGIDRRDQPFGEGPLPSAGDDTLLCDPSKGLYGVFDGLGGYDYAKWASWRAAQTYGRHMAREVPAGQADMTPRAVVDHMVAALATTSKAVREANGLRAVEYEESKPGGASTAAVVRPVEHAGKQYLAYASVGDSRIYMFNRQTQTLRPLATDESYEYEDRKGITRDSLENALGYKDATVNQADYCEVQPGDMVVVCSDGITGMRESALSNTEMIAALSETSTAQEAADRLLEISRRSDDKAVLVLDLSPAT